MRSRPKTFIPNEMVRRYMFECDPSTLNLAEDDICKFESYTDPRAFSKRADNICSYVFCRFPFNVLSTYLSKSDLMDVCVFHGIDSNFTNTRQELSEKVQAHPPCDICLTNVTVVRVVHRNHTDAAQHSTSTLNVHSAILEEFDLPPEDTCTFPSPPQPPEFLSKMIRDFCCEFDAINIEEAGCTVCAQLCIKSTMLQVSETTADFTLLAQPDVARKALLPHVEPHNATQWEPERPVTVPSDYICADCNSVLLSGMRPKLSVANGLWIGEQPEVLKSLTFVEQLLIARARHNKCLVRMTSSGRAKLSANVIMFQNPTPEIYNVLPPSQSELSEVLAYVFIGHAKPNIEDFKQTPMLVRREKVREALEWLTANHCDYTDLSISHDNLNSYPAEGVPVVVEICPTDATINPLGLSSTSEEASDDAQECRFTVHGLTGHSYSSMSVQALKARALQHLQSGGSVLGIGHAEQPLSIFNNPQLYPQMFPCLFPFGYGGFNNTRMKIAISEAAHKKWLMNFHDKRFQRDLYFPMVAFNHEQIKRATTGSFLYAKRNRFPDIAQRIKTLRPETLKHVADSLEAHHTFKAVTEDEKQCMELISDIHHTGVKVQGSMTAKRQMRNEIWSLVKARGAPTWFITFSPADAKHPLCLYYAGNGESFNPTILLPPERNKLVSENPAAAAKCFNFIVKLFLKHILGIDSDHDGLYGKTSAYYATVEQQGRLTLHLHALIWVAGALSPQQIRDRIMSCDELFESELIRYLEACYKGQFLTGDFQSVADKFHPPNNDIVQTYVDPTLTLPDAPPPIVCQEGIASGCVCEHCHLQRQWWQSFNETVDNILLKSNVHNCRASVDKVKALCKQGVPGYTGLSSLTGDGRFLGCMNKYGDCTARFPRDLFSETVVDRTDGYIHVKKLEPMINTYSPVLSYLLRCNTDVTCILSGTTVKALIAYVTDYISKAGLTTHHIFKVANDVLTKDLEKNEIVTNDNDHARRMILKMVNSLAAKMEVGSPLACSYLLGYPDHYTNVSFVSFWWRSYVTEIWETSDALFQSYSRARAQSANDVMLYRSKDEVLGLNVTDDYRYRPIYFDRVPLYAWVQCAKKTTRRSTTTLQPSERFFLPDHPLHTTHEVVFDKQKSASVILNFLGSALPRKDQGDIEYYHCTMLTLFKPWRTASDLKPEGVASWSAAYDLYEFPEKYQKIMANFNLVYECLDARDDFSATRKNRSTTDQLSSDVDLFDNDGDHESALVPGNVDDMILADTGIVTDPLVCEINSIVDSMGWSSPIPPVIQPYLPSASDIMPQEFPDIDWKVVVESHRQHILSTRHREVSFNPVNDPDVSSTSTTGDSLLRVLPPSYFQRDYYPPRLKDRSIISDTINKFHLNTEQQRAFMLVANHSTSSAHPQLLMYLGGMGGTGKTQVLRALTDFFDSRQQSNRLVAAAPTGSASSLLGGSTYHYLLGINYSSNGGGGSRSASSVNLARDRLRSVDYIFLDEISMVACHELCAISRRLADIRSVHERPFGGVNIIFAGDFAQLPPVSGKALYSPLPPIAPKLGQRSIDGALGLFYWHQVTTVVILRQNMRQVTDGSTDSLLRAALRNMRTGSCTAEDIAFLNSRIINTSLETQVASNLQLRMSSVIVARNLQKDRLNELGVDRFALDTNQTLSEFYAADYEVSSKSTTGRKKTRQTILKHVQNYLWDAYPSDTGMAAGKLRLCYGLPVLIKYNAATELCMTNGQEATVVSWNSTIGTRGLPVLSVVFVELTNPPKPVAIEGLPVNVVPITPINTKFKFKIPNTTIELTVDRSQIPLLPNFAMTDFASQGKTRSPNIVDLAYCRNHQSFYTCLSRGTSASTTWILRPFNPRIITSGASGYIRQEFRAIDILDKITSLRFENKLPATVTGNFRKALIESYRNSLPSTEQQTMHEVENMQEIDERLLKHLNHTPPSKRNLPLPSLVSAYWGSRWDSENNSCAYDAVLSLLFNLWLISRSVASLWADAPHPVMSMLLSRFETVRSPSDLRQLRDDFRRLLHDLDPLQFQWGAYLTDIFAVIAGLVGDHTGGCIFQACPACGSNTGGRTVAISPLFCPTLTSECNNESVWVSQVLLCSFHPALQQPCYHCYSNGRATVYSTLFDIQYYPPVIFVDITNPKLVMDLSFDIGTVGYTLRGVIYHGGNHFTARFRSAESEWWFHDGITTGDYWMSESAVENIAVIQSSDAKAAVAVYLRL